MSMLLVLPLGRDEKTVAARSRRPLVFTFVTAQRFHFPTAKRSPGLTGRLINSLDGEGRLVLGAFSTAALIRV